MDNTVERMRALVARDEAGATRLRRFLRDTELSWLRVLRWPLLVALALLGAAVPAIQAGLVALAVPATAAVGVTLAGRDAVIAAIGAAAAGLMLLLVLSELLAGLRWAFGR